MVNINIKDQTVWGIFKKQRLIFSMGFVSIFFLLWGCSDHKIAQIKKVENITAFARLYGYVRWFHPSDEAQQINWDRFACYGVKTVENAPNTDALKDSLLKLFLPIAPTLEIYKGSETGDFDISRVIPSDTGGYFPVYWQHYGIGLELSPLNVYSSFRVNRISAKEYLHSSAVIKMIDASKYKGKSIELSIDLKSETDSKGYIFFDAIGRTEYSRFYDYPKPIITTNNRWENVKLTRWVESDDEIILFGFNNQNSSPVLINSIKLSVINEDSPDSVIYECNLDNSQTIFSADGLSIYSNLPFKVELVSDSLKPDSCLSIAFSKDIKLFDQAPEPGEYIKENIHPGLNIRIPVVLMADNHQTFPVADEDCLLTLKNELSLWLSASSKDLGSLVIAWNIMQHFFPYFEEVEVDWESEFKSSIKRFYKGEDFESNLKKLMAKLKDGHIYVNPPAYKNINALPLKWEWIEDKLVVTEVYDKNARLMEGAVVNKISGQRAEDFFSTLESYIPAATKGALKKGSEFLSLLGTPGDSLEIAVRQDAGTKGNFYVKYSIHPQAIYNRSVNKTRYKILRDNIYYLNLDQITMAEIEGLMHELVQCKGIICDLRGYPNFNHDIMYHLLTINDTVDNWLKIPQVIYPDQKDISFKGSGWNAVPREPRIHAPVVFITDGRAMSAAESVLLFVKHYKLATIVGQPSAGTNGNINNISLPNGYNTRFTGMKVTCLDGSQHFGIGVLPDVYVEKTITGVLEGRDEFLEKALEVIDMKYKY